MHSLAALGALSIAGKWYDELSYYLLIMPKTKVALTLDASLLNRVDELVAKHQFRNRSQAIEAALAEKLERLTRSRLAQECAKLDPKQEQSLADEGLSVTGEMWPEY
jgi:Arc/MetJ-type ribon-helix-helix transcriptional regulator